MDPHITCQTILLPATRSGVVEEGLLVFADDVLMAVVMLLQNSVSDPDLPGRWYLETGYGPCEEAPGTNRLFETSDEAEAWVLECLTRVSEEQA